MVNLSQDKTSLAMAGIIPDLETVLMRLRESPQSYLLDFLEATKSPGDMKALVDRTRRLRARQSSFDLLEEKQKSGRGPELDVQFGIWRNCGPGCCGVEIIRGQNRERGANIRVFGMEVPVKARASELEGGEDAGREPLDRSAWG